VHKGYVDFYSPGHTNLYWSVKRSDPGTGTFKTVFSKLKPLPDGVQRLELDPGPQQFEITILNRLIQTPLTLQVPVQEGMVTPVKVELVHVGEVAVQRKEEDLPGPTVTGRRKTRFSSQPGSLERLVASVQPPLPYRPREQEKYPP
jgi:hypothetical protein